MDKKIIYHSDCKYFRGYIPCKYHKSEGVHCQDCKYYEAKNEIILLIKLGAAGDVIRTTTLLHKIRNVYPNALIWWLTYFPDVLPEDSIDLIFPFNLESIVTLKATEFSLVINLDKDLQASALAKDLTAENKFGFILKDGKPAPVNELAHHKFLTGLFDDVNKANIKSYPEEIFEICGWEFQKEEYILNVDNSIKWDINNNDKKIIGLNTGCGGRWVTRLWSEENWEILINLLQDKGYYPLLLGGEQEHIKNTRIAAKTGADYLGHFSLKKFISLVNQCDAVVTAVTMAMHIVIGLKKPLILMNNIFNKNEFELYGRGVVIEPEKECKCFFSQKCKNPDYFCMDYLKPQTIFDAIEKQLNKK